MEAVREGRLPVVEYLVEKGADMEEKNNVSDAIVTHEYMCICECIRMDSLH